MDSAASDTQPDQDTPASPSTDDQSESGDSVEDESSSSPLAELPPVRVGPIPNTGSDSEDDGTSPSSARQAYIPIPARAFEPHVKDQEDEDEKDFVQPNRIGSGPNIRRPKVVPRQPPAIPPRKPAPPQIIKEFLPIDVVLKTIFEHYYTDGTPRV
jgi:hypothetical protein